MPGIDASVLDQVLFRNVNILQVIYLDMFYIYVSLHNCIMYHAKPEIIECTVKTLKR